MKNKKLIVFLIITNIILIGIIISLISKNEIIKEKQVIKEMSESTQVSNLQNQINQLNASQEEYAKNVQIYKTKLATAITNQGVETSENATEDEIVTNIGNILQTRTSDATATAEDIAEGKTAWVNGEKVTGTNDLKNRMILLSAVAINHATALTNLTSFSNILIDNDYINYSSSTFTIKKVAH